RDVIPDLSDPQIVLVAEWMGHPATEVAGTVTRILTGALDGIPGSTAIRGSSMSSMSFVDVVFRSVSDLPAGRAAIFERVASVKPRLPDNVRVQVGPAASSTGWVFQYILVDPHRQQPLRALRRFQDEVLRPALSGVAGVAEVASLGGDLEEIAVEVSADRLRAANLAFTDVLPVLRNASQPRTPPPVRQIDPLPLPSPPPRPAALP